MIGWLVNLINAELSPKRYILAGTEIPGGRGRGRLYLTLHCHHHNDSCTKTGGAENHCNVLLIVSDKITRKYTETERRTEAELTRCPSAYQTNAQVPRF